MPMRMDAKQSSRDAQTSPSSSRSQSTDSDRNSPSSPSLHVADPSQPEPDILIDTLALQERYRFFEEFKERAMEPKRFEMTPPRDVSVVRPASPVDPAINRDPNVVRCTDVVDDIPKTDTTKKMLSVFKRLESQSNGTSSKPPEPKPLKRITPPRDLDIVRSQSVVLNGDNHYENGVKEPEIVRSSTKSEDVIPVEPEMARSLRAKFENWASEVGNNNRNRNGSYDLPNDYTPQLDMAKNLKAKFESFRNDINKPAMEKRRPRVNRFVHEISEGQNEHCSVCGKILYALEKVEFGGAKMHRSCFKCAHCLSSLRMDNYTLAAGKFYCLTHFKQLFMSKGNYDEGFGREQHKEKWNAVRTSSRNQAMDDSENVGSGDASALDASVVSVS